MGKFDEKLVQEKVKEIEKLNLEYEKCCKEEGEYQERYTQCRLQAASLFEKKKILERELLELLKN